MGKKEAEVSRKSSKSQPPAKAKGSNSSLQKLGKSVVKKKQNKAASAASTTPIKSRKSKSITPTKRRDTTPVKGKVVEAKKKRNPK